MKPKSSSRSLHRCIFAAVSVVVLQLLPAPANDGALNGWRFFETRTLDWMTNTLVQGQDRVLLLDTAFAAGFMRDPVDMHGKKSRALFGPSHFAFGQPGAGGSHAFADPEHGLSFAYVMNKMEPGVLPGPKALRLVEALYE